MSVTRKNNFWIAHFRHRHFPQISETVELHAESSKTVIFSQYLVLPPLAAMIAGITDSNWELISFRTLAMGADSQVVSRECFHIFIVRVLCEFSSRRSKSLTIEFLLGRGGEGELLRLCVFLVVVSKLRLVGVAVVRPRRHSVFVFSGASAACLAVKSWPT